MIDCRGVVLLGLVVAGVSAQCAQWAPPAGIPGVNGTIHAAVRWDPDGAGPAPEQVAVGGFFSTAGAVAATNIAAFDPQTGTWSALGAGMDNLVRCLVALPSGELVAGGSFASADGQTVNSIARWNGSAWQPLGTGLRTAVTNGLCAALSVLPSGELVAAGAFSFAGTTATDNVARWNGSTWQAFGLGLQAPGGVSACAVRGNGELLVGGSGISSGAATIGALARWNGAQWLPAANAAMSVNQLVTATSGDVLMLGLFLPSERLAVFGSAGVVIVPTPVSSPPTVVAPLPNGDILLGGNFTQIGGATMNRVARWNGSAWSPLASGITSPADAHVRALVPLANGELLVGGDFRIAGDVPTLSFARWNGAAWSSATVNSSPNGVVRTLRFEPNGDLVAGGEFTSIGAVAAARIAVRSGGGWQSLGSGCDGTVRAVARAPNGDLVVGGDFATAGGVPADRVARWDGSSWSALGSGVNGSVRQVVAMPNGDIVVGGGFSAAGLVNADQIARWDGSSWSGFPALQGGYLVALAVLPNGDLVAAINLGLLNGAVLRWSGGVWVTLGTAALLNAMTVLPNGDLAIAGSFTSVTGVPANRVARWNGSSWQAAIGNLGNTSIGSSTVLGLAALPNGDLVLAGSAMTAAGITPPQNLLRAVGTAFALLGGGVNDQVHALAVSSRGELVVGGRFLSTDGAANAYLASYRSTCPATVQSTAAGCAGSGGSNTLAALTLPWLGSTFRARGSGLPTNALVVDAFGLATASLPLAAVLPPAPPACTIHVAPDLLRLGSASGGVFDSALDLPNTGALVGVVLHEQLVLLELGAQGQLLQSTASDRLTLTLGDF